VAPATSPGFSRPRRSGAGFAPPAAPLFWDPPHKDWIAVAMGAFDGPTGTRLNKHIFVADKGDYYDIGDGLPQNRQ